MIVLALDTSSQAASCALTRDGNLIGESFLNVALTHSQTILPLVEALLRHTGTPLGEVERFAVSTGPGSFTGLRIGISAVKGMAMAGDKPCAAVSTLEGLAGNLSGYPGIVVPAMDARRDQVYTAAFSCEGGAPSRLWADTAIFIADLRKRLAGFGEGRIVLVGDGARLCKAAMTDLPHVIVAPEHLLHQRAGSIALAAHAIPPESLCTPALLTPAYLRLPQAERERLAKLKR